MNFDKAFKELMGGAKIRRKTWEKLMHIAIIDMQVKTFKGQAINLYPDPNILLSADWWVMGEEFKSRTFVECLPELKQKKAITMDALAGGFVFVDNNELVKCSAVEYTFMPTFEDLCATDWEVMK